MSDLNIDPNLEGLETPPESNATPPDWTSTFLDIDEDIEVVGEGVAPPEGAEIPPDEVAELREKLKEQQARISELTTTRQVEAAMKPVVDQINQLQQPQQQAAQQPGESDAEFKTRIDENYLETGLTGAIDEVFARRLRPEIQRLLQNNLYSSRRFVMLDPEKGPLYSKYKQEVEAHIAQLPPQEKLYSPEVYDTAVATIAARHGDEIINEKLAQALEAEREKIKEELKAELGVAAAPTAKPTFSATTPNQPPPDRAAGGNRMSPAQLQVRFPQHVKDAAARGIPAHRYFKYLAKKGLLK